jgi:hypothetical protein
MTNRLTAIALVAAVTLGAAPSFAESREQNRGGRREPSRGAGPAQPSGRAVPRTVPRTGRPPTVVAPYRPYGYRPNYGFSFRYGYPYGYRYPYGYGYGYGYPYGYSNYGYGYGYPAPGYYSGVPGQLYGGVRIQGAPRDAAVYTDGYYVGVVNDFDGTFQHLNLEEGPHRIEIRAPGYPPIEFDVNVQPGQTITYRADVVQP